MIDKAGVLYAKLAKGFLLPLPEEKPLRLVRQKTQTQFILDAGGLADS